MDFADLALAGFWPHSQYFATPVFLTLAVAAFVLGACVGSFLNVVIYRLPLGLSVADPKRSFCPSCRYQIPMWHNIPLVSWLLLKGKCANCGSGISPRYLLVELLTAVLFLITFLWFRDQVWLVIPMWIFLSLCVAATYIDFDHMIIPDQITLGGMVAGVLCSVIFPSMIVTTVGESKLAPWLPEFLSSLRWVNLIESLVGAALGLLLVWLVVRLGKLLFGRLHYKFKEPSPWEIGQPEGEPEPIITLGGDKLLWTDVFFRPTDRLRLTCQELSLNDEPRGPGLLTLSEGTVHWKPEQGDAETRPLEGVRHLSGLTTQAVVPREAMGLGDVKFMGLVGAFLGWKGILFTLFAASILGSLVAMVMIVLRRREWAARIPFGPYLALGATLWIFFGPAFIQWYWTLTFGLGR